MDQQDQVVPDKSNNLNVGKGFKYGSIEPDYRVRPKMGCLQREALNFIA